MGKLETLAEYGYHKDPFGTVSMETADSVRIRRVISMAVESRAMVSIVAERGSGKTSALKLALDEMDVRVVRLFTPDKERVLVGDIERALVVELSQENVARSREIRARQLKRILGEASRQRQVVLILEEAHRIHGQTLRSLKTMREMEWMGVYPLFTVVMVGQYDPMRKRGVDEVRLRTDTVHMKGMTASEIRGYISATVGKFFEEDAIEALSRIGGRNFLELQERLVTLMERALCIGQKKVTAMEVFEVYGGGLKEVMKRVNVGLPELEKETGLSKSTLSLITNDKQGTLTDEKASDVRQAVAEVLRKRMATTPAPPNQGGESAEGKGLRAVS